MQNDHEEVVRPFARIMANEVSHDETEVMAKKSPFLTFRSGHAFLDMPDTGGG
jgi:hypothetical protein